MCGIWLANIIWLGCIIRGAVIGCDIQALADELNLGMPEAPLLLTPPLRGGGKRRGGRGGGAESLLFDMFLVIVSQRTSISAVYDARIIFQLRTNHFQQTTRLVVSYVSRHVSLNHELDHLLLNIDTRFQDVTLLLNERAAVWRPYGKNPYGT